QWAERRLAMSHVPGGGPKSRQITERPVRTGTGSKGTRPAGVAMFGTMQGDHSTAHGGAPTGYKGERLHSDRSFQPVKIGNEVALNVGKGGCGTGRTLYGQAGSQGTHGATNPGNPRPNRYRDALEQEYETTMVELRLKGKSMDQRVADRLKNSGDTAHADHSVVHGTGPTRTHTNIHHSRNTQYGAGHPGEGSITRAKRGVV